ncbi:HerA-ATP synthase, barrel domain-containing protein [Planktothrix tepida]|uniref:HerA-ATP synthase, barrel domain-containing protein n=2 Tax=Planktothrix TaxID=54304 RepID=A0A1J1LSB1_9CYAN|nr:MULTISPECIES: HAS-barrel domain-containing protein [Planktothrix]CAD5949411.1 HerA-ATP synthase, barrel domain-containing protein [Planktothrix pseudagardhii]CAD5960985.1 HerA-ATP synthase, barrel domain-containing protein [Planktothrix tepida]CUR34740.1 HerA-ATP synthase, barrel domain-containing protein [Planktothrix tepida PCC 9214]
MRLPFPIFSTSRRPQQHIAEVIETATTEYLAQCLEPEDLSFPVMPAFGSWVKSRDEESGNQVYGVVYYATTSPIDSVHRARALGLTLEELREQQPQIFAMLKTEFRVAIVGFEMTNPERSQRGKIYQYIPPRPPQIHQAVYECHPDEIVNFSQELDFLRTLLDVRNAPVDSLVAAAIREIYQLRKLDRGWLIEAGRTLSILLKDDYDRLRIILKQIHP